MQKLDFVNALRTLGEQVGRDLAPGDDGAYHYEFDDGLTCIAAYHEDSACAVLVAVLGSIPETEAARLAACERLLEWNNVPEATSTGKLSLDPESNHVHFLETLNDHDLEPARFETRFATFLNRAADLRNRYLDLGDDTDFNEDGDSETSTPQTGVIVG